MLSEFFRTHCLCEWKCWITSLIFTLFLLFFPFSSGNLSPTAQTLTVPRNVGLFFSRKKIDQCVILKSCCAAMCVIDDPVGLCLIFQCRVPADKLGEGMTWRSPWSWWVGWCSLCSSFCFALPVSGVPVPLTKHLGPIMSVNLTLLKMFHTLTNSLLRWCSAYCVPWTFFDCA